MMPVFAIAIFLYSAAIIYLVYGFSKVKETALGEMPPQTKFTIVVPFRNEAQNLPKLLESFSALDYPLELFEVILVDDDSNDDFTFGAENFRFQVVKNDRISGSPKKDAILTAIRLSRHDWIVTTDADCMVSENWLLYFDGFIRSTPGTEMVAGSVDYQADESFLHQFQQMEIAALQGTTLGSFGWGRPFMCNGANFAYTKSLFGKIGGFRGNENTAGGDDVFLLQKAAAQFPRQVHYLKSAGHIVLTKPCPEWKSLFYQRVRWAAKASGYQSGFGKILGMAVFFGNLFFVMGFGYLVLGFGFWPFIFMILKSLSDYILISKMNHYLGKPMRFYMLSALVYPFFSTVVALYSIFGKYEWKGRRFRK